MRWACFEIGGTFKCKINTGEKILNEKYIGKKDYINNEIIIIKKRRIKN